MTHKFHILSLICGGMLWCGHTKADDSILNRNVTVEREYHPVIKEASKINAAPKVLELKAGKITPDYTDFNLPLEAGFNIHTLAAATPETSGSRESTPGFIRAGIGNNWNTLFDFAYPLLKTPETRLDFSVNHLGTFGQKAHATTKASLAFDRFFDSFTLHAGLGFGHEYLKYYGSNFNDSNAVRGDGRLSSPVAPLTSYKELDYVALTRKTQPLSLLELSKLPETNNFLRTNAYFGLRSRQNDEDLQYNAMLQYKSFHATSGQTENIVHTHGGLSSPRDNNRLGIDFDLYNLWYRSDSLNALNFYESYAMMNLNPYYLLQGSTYSLRLGLNTNFSFGHGRAFSPSLDIRGEWQAVPGLFALYGGITGGYNLNTLDAMYSQNRYLSHDVRVTDNYTPAEISAGFKTKPAYNFLIDAYVNYKNTENQYFFINKAYAATTVHTADSVLYTNRFNVIYSNASRFKAGTRLSYTLRDIADIGLAAAYNHWNVNNESHAWNMPAWEMSLNAQIRVDNNLSLSTDLFADGGRYAKIGNQAIAMKSRLDLNLGASYTYDKWVTAFARLNNLFNSRYQDFYGYEVQGINVMIGAALAF